MSPCKDSSASTRGMTLASLFHHSDWSWTEPSRSLGPCFIAGQVARGQRVSEDFEGSVGYLELDDRLRTPWDVALEGLGTRITSGGEVDFSSLARWDENFL
jgi:hypothetical protein